MQRSNSTASLSSAASNKILILLTNEAFIKHKSRWEEEEQVKEQQIDSRDPRSRYQSVYRCWCLWIGVYLWIALTKKANIQVDLVSPWGGAVPADPDSLNRLMKDEALLKEFRSPSEFITLDGPHVPDSSCPPSWIQGRNYYRILWSHVWFARLSQGPKCPDQYLWKQWVFVHDRPWRCSFNQFAWPEGTILQQLPSQQQEHCLPHQSRKKKKSVLNVSSPSWSKIVWRNTGQRFKNRNRLSLMWLLMRDWLQRRILLLSVISS